jgi:hypothetical protein
VTTNKKISVTTKSMRTAYGREQKIDGTTMNEISLARVLAVSLVGKSQAWTVVKHRQAKLGTK